MAQSFSNVLVFLVTLHSFLLVESASPFHRVLNGESSLLSGYASNNTENGCNFTCPKGAVLRCFDTSSTVCPEKCACLPIVCPEGYFVNEDLNVCEVTCPHGTVRNEQTRQCEALNVDAGIDQVGTIETGENVTFLLDGSNSSSPVQGEIYFQWAIVFPEQPDAVLSDPSGTTALLMVSEPGVYNVSLTMVLTTADGQTANSTDFVSVFVPGVVMTLQQGDCWTDVDCNFTFAVAGFGSEGFNLLLFSGPETSGALELTASLDNVSYSQRGLPQVYHVAARIAGPSSPGQYNVSVILRAIFRSRVSAKGADSSFVAMNLKTTVQNQYFYTVGEFGNCSKSCGPGERTRQVSCRRYSGEVVGDVLCGLQPRPVSSIQCFLRPCESFGVEAGDWSQCSKLCGSGYQSRNITCRNATNDIVDISLCSGAGIVIPQSNRSCNTQLCEVFSYSVIDLGCSDQCGNSSVLYRNVLCEGTFGTVVPLTSGKCPGSPPSFQVPCTGLPPCTRYEWRVGAWSACNQSCAVDGRAGITSRRVYCFDRDNSMEVNDSNCKEAKRPSAERSCNDFPCAVYRVVISPWSTCSRVAPGSCQGRRTRSVRCLRVNSNGDEAEVPYEKCVLNAGAPATPPRTSKSCDACGYCGSTLATYCSGHGSCGSSGSCECSDGFIGEFCQFAQECPPGQVLDRDDNCCDGVLSADRQCCKTIDRDGKCCVFDLDGCGVCNGTGITDAVGTCCDVGNGGELDADGVCCTAGLDSLGVCGGVNDGTQAVDLRMGNSAGLNADSVKNIANPLVQELYDTTRRHAATSLDRPFSSVLVDAFDVVAARRILRQYGVDEALLESIGVRVLSSTTLEAALRLLSLGGDNYRRPDQLLAKLTAIPPESPLVDVKGVVRAVMEADCGNGRCEFGERPNPSAGIVGCAADCQNVVLACPTGENRLECSGNGICVAGKCECFSAGGYTGSACDSCDAEYTKVSAATCLRTAFSPSCTDGIQNGDETGVDCGGSCPPCPTSGSDDSDNTAVIIIAVVAGVVVLGFVAGFVWLVKRGKLGKSRGIKAHPAGWGELSENTESRHGPQTKSTEVV